MGNCGTGRSNQGNVPLLSGSRTGPAHHRAGTPRTTRRNGLSVSGSIVLDAAHVPSRRGQRIELDRPVNYSRDMARSFDTRGRLVAAAVDLIHSRSYGAVGVQEICSAAGVRKGSFYHFFPSKRDLMLAALDELWAQLRERVFDPAFAEDIEPLDRIVRFFERSAALQREYFERTGHVLGCPLGNLALEMSTQDTFLRERVDALFRAAERRIAGSLKAASADGSLPGVEPESAARSVFAYMEGLLLMAKTRNDPDLIRDSGPAAVALVHARSDSRAA